MKSKKTLGNKPTKQKWIRENYIYIILIGGLFVTMYCVNIYQNSTSYICSKNSDKCVCEEYNELLVINENLIDPPTSHQEPSNICKQLRLKTQAELDIDDCNNNPREDDLCKCEEYLGTDCYIEAVYEQEFLLSNGNWANLTTHFKVNGTEQCYPVDVNLAKINSSKFRLISANKITINEYCLKSRPKFDYEKHPEDYVAETKCNEEEINYQNKSCINTCSDKFGVANSNYRECLNINCQRIEICLNNITTYRLKNECEKGNPDWVEGVDINNLQCKEYQIVIDGFINKEYNRIIEVKLPNSTHELDNFCKLGWNIKSRTCKTKLRTYMLNCIRFQTICSKRG